MPDYDVIKSVSNPGFLMDAKLKWIALGRDPKKLFTLYRHFDVFTCPDGFTFMLACMHWNTMFRRWVNKEFIERYAQYVDFVSESNEYTSESAWLDPDTKRNRLINMEAAAFVWNNWFRGKSVTVDHDGGTFTGTVPAHIRLVIMSGPPGNGFPREVFEIALKYNCPIDYHNYMFYHNGQRLWNDWRDLSGKWNTLETEYQAFPDWIFGEGSPCLSTFEGWRSQNVLAGNEEALYRAIADLCTDMSKTRAYREGRLYGYSCLFTQFDGSSEWGNFLLSGNHLVEIAKRVNPIWHPAPPQENKPMNENEKTVIRGVIVNQESDRAKLKNLLLHNMTNQEVINLFSRTFGGLTELAGTGLISGMTVPAENRKLLYTGPDVATIPNLNSDQRTKVLNAI